MHRDTYLLIVAVLVIIYSISSGIHGIVKRKKINNCANLILSVGQVIIGIMFILGIFVFISIGKLKI